MRNILVGVGAFLGGIIYASYKLDENPNKVFKMAGDDVNAAANKIAETVNKSVNKAKASTKENC